MSGVLHTSAAVIPSATAATSFPSTGGTPLADLPVDRGNGLLTYLYADLHMTADKQAVMDQIREVRARGWDANPVIRYFSLVDYSMHTEPLREAAAREGFYTLEAYQTGINWDFGLEPGVIQRAAEENDNFDHVRPDGRDSFTVNGISGGENLSPDNMSVAARNFAFAASGNSSSEWDKLLAGDLDNAGHALNILNPAFKHFAQAQVGGVTAQVFTWDAAPEAAAPQQDSRYVFPVMFPTSRLADATLRTGSTYVGESGQAQAIIEAHSTFALPGRYTSSAPEILNVNPDGSYEAVATGTATIIFQPMIYANGVVSFGGTQVTREVTITQRPAASSESSSHEGGNGADAGTIVGIITGVLALLGWLHKSCAS